MIQFTNYKGEGRASFDSFPTQFQNIISQCNPTAQFHSTNPQHNVISTRVRGGPGQWGCQLLMGVRWQLAWRRWQSQRRAWPEPPHHVAAMLPDLHTCHTSCSAVCFHLISIAQDVTVRDFNWKQVQWIRWWVGHKSKKRSKGMLLLMQIKHCCCERRMVLRKL